MQILIDIPEKFYHDIKTGNTGSFSIRNIAIYAIENGTPLPKGHGRLIDADALIKSTDKEEVHLYEIALTPTIIDADKESEV